MPPANGASKRQDIGLTIDGILLGNTAVSASQPAGLLNGLAPLTPTAGGGTNALLTDVKALINTIAPAMRPVLIVNSTQAASKLAQAAPPIVIAPYLTAGTAICVDSAAFGGLTRRWSGIWRC